MSRMRRVSEEAGLAISAPGGLAGLGVLAQIASPLVSGVALRSATIASVGLLTGAALAHLGRAAGWRAAVRLLVVAGGIGLLAEVTGVHTGVPFGRYDYSGALGPRVGGVPLLVPLAWTMLAYPALLLGRRMSAGPDGIRSRWRTALLGGVALASWDLFLDPQMVANGYWRWSRPDPSLPGVPGVPLTNYGGWLLVSLVMVAALDLVLDRALRPVPPTASSAAPQPVPPSGARGELVPAAVLAWTWLGSTVGNLAFFGRPWVAVWGGLIMGAAVLPYLLRMIGSVPPRAGSAPVRVKVAS